MTQPSTDPSPPPRPIDGRTSRRAWGEPHVRFWWLSAIVFAVIAAVLVYTSVREWNRQKRLIAEGLPVKAEVIRAGGIYLRTKKIAPHEPVDLKYQVNGRTIEVSGYLDGRTDFIIVGDPVDIRVDPKNPAIWTYRTQPMPLAGMMIGAWIVVPITLLVAGVAMLKRARLLSIWKNGVAQPAIFVSSRQTALAPTSRLVSCMRREGKDRRVLRVYLPQAIATHLARGDEFWIIAPDESSTSAVAAVWFE